MAHPLKKYGFNKGDAVFILPSHQEGREAQEKIQVQNQLLSTLWRYFRDILALPYG
jgi:hypothetical protein